MKPEKIIDTHQANLKTATIEVKSLTVNNRKLTLSTFRQIPEENIIDHDTGQLLGTPWGKVNYYWGDESSHDRRGNETPHVLWQNGSELRRSLINYPRDGHLDRVNDVKEDIEGWWWNNDALHSWIIRIFYSRSLNGLNDARLGFLINLNQTDFMLMEEWLEQHPEPQKPEKKENINGWFYKEGELESYEEQKPLWDKLREDYKSRCLENVDTAAKIGQQRFERDIDLYNQMCNLDQIFIAV